MVHVRVVAVTVMAMFAMSAFAAAEVQANEAPFWSTSKNASESKRLKAGETRGFEAPGTKAFVLKGGTDEIECTSEKTMAGAVIIGSAKGDPGTTAETVEFAGCSAKEGVKTCTIPGGTITTRPLKSELVYNAKESKKVDSLFTPATGQEFAKVALTGCVVSEVKVTGSVAAEDLNESNEAVELGKLSASARKWFRRFVSGIHKIILILSGSPKVVSVELNAFGVESTLEGESELKLLSGETWSVLP